MGFGSLLNATLSLCDCELLRYLLERFDVGRCSIHLEEEELLLGDDDVQKTLGIPRGQQTVVEAEITSKDPQFTGLVALWRQRWGVKTGTPTTSQMLNGIIERRDHGDMFKRDFIIYVVSTLIRGFKNMFCNYRLLYSLQDVSKIQDFNWCAYTIRSLVDTTTTWRGKRDAAFTGPATFLMVRGEIVRKRIPTITSWTSSDLRARVKVERDIGGFGKGKVVEYIPDAHQPPPPQLSPPVNCHKVRKLKRSPPH
ncbi:PREDICTED: uncharacterized protein LOC109184663 [Ipomoea nil]|uniref:uncharacterized protein LOC109184663 n=1 Tax=Ipomoea nil TaxID=35883 RepID=UPI000901B6FD|nr:PREDICTED: uncharacterized protein LOC109184663 [Ipomoea nil]